MHLVLVVAASLLVAATPLLGQPVGDVLWPDTDSVETFLERAEVVSRVKVGSGVTDSDKVELELDGRVEHAIFKKIDTPHDSWKREVAAYELDKLLGVGMVPPTVERSLRGRRGCMQLWVTGQSLNDISESPPDLQDWRLQVAVMWLLDELSGNTDRHLNNVVVTGDYRLVLIDNSRAFKSHEELLHGLNLADTATRTQFWWGDFEPGSEAFPAEFREEVVDRLRALDERSVKQVLGRYVDGNLRQKLLTRRDAIVDRLGPE